MSSISNIKKRINSINTTSKITQAMKLVATTKIQKQKNELTKINSFINDLYNLVESLTSKSSFNDAFKNRKLANKNLYIVMSSSLGLCGAFNNNVVKHAIKDITANDDIITIGTKAYSNLKMRGYDKQIVDQFEFSTTINYLECLPLVQTIVTEFKNCKYDKVFIVYTKFVSSLTFDPVTFQLLPLDPTLFKSNSNNNTNLVDQIDDKGRIIEFEPNNVEIINSVLPFYASSMLIACETESRLCEYSSRRNSMETASDNAKELINNLKLEYNQARQEKITQEINEIVAGANK